METILDTLTDDYPTVTFIRLDVDKVDEILYEMPLKALPTVIIFQGAKGVGKVEGVKEIVLRDVIRKLLAWYNYIWHRYCLAYKNTIVILNILQGAYM